MISKINSAKQDPKKKEKEEKKKAAQERVKAKAESEATEGEAKAEDEEKKGTDEGHHQIPPGLVAENYPSCSGYIQIAKRAHDLTLSDNFNLFIIGCICLAGVLVGIQTYDDNEWVPMKDRSFFVFLEGVDIVILIIFSLEVILKIFAEGAKPWRYWVGPEWNWNNFDFFIVILSLPDGPMTMISSGEGGGSQVKLLRLMRLMRIAKIVRKVPQLQMIVMGLIGGMKSIGYIVLLLFLVFYLFAIAGIMWFRENDPWHFRSLGQ
mmetsp:Transcript_103834/g.298919  ORF Transcript_103834/g.298919 Transcript_103834/m.298919 type:complete len:264 (+) Transcript_103834:348-1139(+)